MKVDHRIKKHLELLERIKRRKVFFKVRNIIERSTKFYTKALKQDVHSIQDLYYVIGGIVDFIMELEVELTESNADLTKKTNLLMSRLILTQDDIYDKIESIVVALNKKEKKLEKEVLFRLQNFSKDLDSFKKARLPHTKRVYLSMRSYDGPIFFRKNKKYFSFIKGKKLPALVSYYHEKGSIIKRGDLSGVQIQVKNPVFKNSHQAIVIDTIKNEKGEVRFIVVLNSGGKSFAYKGINFIHISYSDHLKEIHYPREKDFKISHKKSCHHTMVDFD